MSWPITIASASVTWTKAAPNSSASGSSHWSGTTPRTSYAFTICDRSATTASPPEVLRVSYGAPDGTRRTCTEPPATTTRRRRRRRPPAAQGSIQPSTTVLCPTTIRHITSSRPRLQGRTLRSRSPSLPASPTAAQAIVRFCGEIILPSTPPGAVGGGEQLGREAGLACGGHLERAEEGVGRGVGAGDGDAEPAEHRREEGEPGTGRGDEVADGGGLSGEVHDVGEGEHGRHGEDRVAQFVHGGGPFPHRRAAPYADARRR